MSGKKKGGKKPEGDSKTTPLGKIGDVNDVLKSFLSDNCTFPSSTVVKLIMEKIATLNDVYDIFLVPIKEKVLDFEGAKSWAFFLNSMTFRKFIAEDVKFATYKFDVAKALEQIETVYDLAMDDYNSYIDGEDDEESEHSRSRGHSE